LCLAFYASRFNTGTVTENSDGSSDYGIFQINSRRWCSDQRSRTLDLCQTRC
ncbi:unnamed protein product, partial [Natator depressus]